MRMTVLKNAWCLTTKLDFELVLPIISLLGIVLVFVSFYIPSKSVSTVLCTIGIASALGGGLLLLGAYENRKIRAIEEVIGSRVIEYRKIDEGWKEVDKYRVLASGGKGYVVIVRGMKVISTREVECKSGTE